MASSGASHRIFLQTLKTASRNYNVLSVLPESGSIPVNKACERQKRLLHSSPKCCHEHKTSHHVCTRTATPWGPPSVHRTISTSSVRPAEAKQNQIADTEPFKLVAEDMKHLPRDICKVLESDNPRMQYMAQYFFGRGKTFRPMVVMLMSKLCNSQNNMGDSVMPSQRIVAMVAEMLQTASLIHDDVVDAADTRRGIMSLNRKCGNRRAILSGNFLHTQASKIIASIGNPRVVCSHATAVEDIIAGEFMQLSTKEDEDARFQLYLKKTHKKTASPISAYCQCAAILSGVGEDRIEAAYEYGRNLGMSYQVIDDILDLVVSAESMGKTTSSDLKLGIVNAPVLYAAKECKELHPLIMRRFSEKGDVEYARDVIINKSSALDKTRELANQFIEEANRQLTYFAPSRVRDALAEVPHMLSRLKV